MFEGLRQYFDAGLSLASGEAKVFTAVKGTNLHSGPISTTTTTSETKAFVTLDFSKIMDNHGNNKPNAPEVAAGIETNVTESAGAQATMNPAGIPVNLSVNNTLNGKDASQTIEGEVSVGLDKGPVQGKVFVNNSTTRQTNGTSENQTNVGVRVEVPIYTIGSQSITVGRQIQVTHKQ